MTDFKIPAWVIAAGLVGFILWERHNATAPIPQPSQGVSPDLGTAPLAPSGQFPINLYTADTLQ